MTTVFLVLLLVHSLHSVFSHVVIGRSILATPRKWLVVILQSALFVMAVVYAYNSGVFSRALVSPVWIGLGLVAGHLIFGFSLLVTHRSAEDASSHFLDFASVWRFIVDHPSVLARFIYVGLTEEIIWRAAGQPIATRALAGAFGTEVNSELAVWIGVVIIAVAFAAVHEHFLRNAPLVSLEFLLFALLLGTLFHFTGSLILVIIIHSLRDIEIAYLEYAIRVHELGDETLAAEEVEKTYARPLRRRA